ncbi:MAG: hypothetical protein HRU19_02845 [Pseudobacteriovorax sp.]|nr:hypothetical protein [Pseudobacteriovorax sp.]
MSNTNSQQTRTEKKALHLSVDLLEKFKALQEEANKKDFGKRVSLGDVAEAVMQFTDTKKVVDSLRKGSLTPQNQVDYIYSKYCAENGKIDFNSFLLKALTGQINVNLDPAALSQAVGS